MESLFLIAGLGNPGSEYARTRHNAGFMVVEHMAERAKARWKSETKFQARLARVELGERKAILCEPQTFMNLSGESIRAVAEYFQVPTGQVLVIVDDADLPLGEIRLRPTGSAGGHHGLESVEAHLGTRDYPRLRVGIGRQSSGSRQITGYVLGRFGADEAELVGKILERASLQAECWLTSGAQKAMNQFNGAVVAPMAKDR